MLLRGILEDLLSGVHLPAPLGAHRVGVMSVGGWCREGKTDEITDATSPPVRCRHPSFEKTVVSVCASTTDTIHQSDPSSIECI